MPTDVNLADHASRGVRVEEKEKFEMWLSGPEYLLKAEKYWPKGFEQIPVIEDHEPELKKSACVNLVQENTRTAIHDLVKRYSSWTRL